MKAHEDILSNSSLMLIQGMETQNQSQAANALKVFYNLKILDQKVEATVSGITDKVVKTTKAILAEEVQRDSA